MLLLWVYELSPLFVALMYITWVSGSRNSLPFMDTCVLHLWHLFFWSWKARQRLAILPVSKARTNKFYIYRQCTYIVYTCGEHRCPWRVRNHQINTKQSHVVNADVHELKGKKPNKRHSSPFINVVKGVFFRVTLVPVSYLSAPSAVHSYRVPGKFIRLVRTMYVYCIYMWWT
jgi:hypothetical protein